MKKRYICGLVILLVLASVSTCLIINHKLNNEKVTVKDNVTLADLKIDDVVDDRKIVDEYINKYNNQDVIGEISIPNTDFKRALMQSSDNNYYLYHTEDKTESFMGSIYLDYRVNLENSKKLLVYGHNSDSIVMPFDILENYYDKSYYNEHKYIKIKTNEKEYMYVIYSVYVEAKDFSYMNINFSDEQEWYNHIKSFKDKSMYDTLEDVAANDEILILQTCSTHKDYLKYDRKFLLVVAKQVK